MIACSIVSPSGKVEGSTTQVPGRVLNDDRTCTFTPNRRAYSTQRRCSTFAPDAAISSISSVEMRSMRRAVGTMRGSAVNTPSTSV
jgi:hypothetical protein